MWPLHLLLLVHLLSRAVANRQVAAAEWTGNSDCVPLRNKAQARCSSWDSIDDLPERVINLEFVGNFTTIQGSPFRNRSSLLALTFESESLASVSEDAFVGLDRLQWVSFANSSLTSLPIDVFKHNPNLTYVRVSSSKLTNVSLVTPALRPLSGYDFALSHCPLVASIGENDFGNLPGLTSLMVHRNRMTSFHPGATGGLSSLKYFSIDNYAGSLTTEAILSVLAQLPKDALTDTEIYLSTLDEVSAIASSCDDELTWDCVHKCADE